MNYITKIPIQTGTIIVMLVLLLATVPGWLAAHAPGEDGAPQWVSLERAQEAAAVDGKNIMVFVEASWCGICPRIKQEVFPEAGVRALMEENFYAVRIDLDSQEKVFFNGQEMTEREFARTINVQATPTMLFIDPQGEIMANQTGYIEPERFAHLLQFIDSPSFGEISFDEFLEGVDS